MKKTTYLSTIAKSVVIAGVLSATASFGASITFSTSVSVIHGSNNSGTVTLTDGLAANTVRVSVALPTGYGFVNTGGPHTPFTFNLDNETGATVSFVSPAPGPFAVNFSGGANTPYGTFGVAIDMPNTGNGSGNGYFGNLVFDVTRTSLTLSSFTAVGGYYFAADLTNNINGGNTGAVAWSGGGDTPPGVPDGGVSVALLGFALAGLALARRFAFKG